MATLVDLTNQMNALTDAISGANDSMDALTRNTGSLVQAGFPTPATRGQLSLEPLGQQTPTISTSRDALSLLTGFFAGLDVGPTFLNYASTFLGFGASGFEETTTRAGIQGG